MPQHRKALFTGTLFAAAAGLMWGLVFIAPLLLPEYPAALLAMARYLAFGLIALPLGFLDRSRLASLSRADWLEALKLSTIGNLLYYLCLAAAIQRAGAPLPTMLIGTLPVVIAVVSNRRDAARDGRLRWRQLGPSLLLIGAGIACVNHDEMQALHGANGATWSRYASGALLAVGAVACWTWYPLRNADWLRAHADRPPSTWATAQGLATLPLAALGYAAFWVWTAVSGDVGGHGTAAFETPLGTAFTMPFGPTPLRFVALMFTIGLTASWLGTLCWNEASQRLPTTLAGQLIVFETLSALAYAYALRGHWPPLATGAGVLLLVAGVIGALRARPAPAH
jgi:drug/metabolite transporter (DMT)-like permease